MALPEKRPPKSITSRTLLRFWPSAWMLHIEPIGFVESAPAEAFT